MWPETHKVAPSKTQFVVGDKNPYPSRLSSSCQEGPKMREYLPSNISFKDRNTPAVNLLNRTPHVAYTFRFNKPFGSGKSSPEKLGVKKPGLDLFHASRFKLWEVIQQILDFLVELFCFYLK